MPTLVKACVTTQTLIWPKRFSTMPVPSPKPSDCPKAAARGLSLFHRTPEFGDLPFTHEDFDLEHVPDEDWVSRSQQNLPPVQVPPFFLFGHHDRPHARHARHHIEMDAGLAFGSGHHETTQGCLHLLAHVLKKHRPAQAADIGTGSGILAIALAKAGCRHVFACDNDPDAVRVARQNFKINNLPAHIRPIWCNGLAHPAARQAGPFDLIMANILAAPLITMASTMAMHLAPAGQLILSGLLNTQRQRVVARYRHAGLPCKKISALARGRVLCFGVKLTAMFQDFEDPKDTKNTAQHVKLLRRTMAENGLDAFIVPREDAFQGEYVPPANERLKWLTGFGGSAGVAVVTTRQAAVFVDGRYILQAPDQVDTNIFEIVPIAETGPLKWLEKLRKNQRIGLDPKLHTLAFAGAVEKLARRKGLDIDYVADNPD